MGGCGRQGKRLPFLSSIIFDWQLRYTPSRRQARRGQCHFREQWRHYALSPWNQLGRLAGEHDNVQIAGKWRHTTDVGNCEEPPRTKSVSVVQIATDRRIVIVIARKISRWIIGDRQRKYFRTNSSKSNVIFEKQTSMGSPCVWCEHTRRRLRAVVDVMC